MSTQDDVREIALGLPATTEDPNFFRFFVEGKQFAWVYPERIEPKKPRVNNPEVLVVHTGTELEKDALLSLDPEALFTTPHYDGYAAVLVRLPLVDRDRLADLLEAAWRARAPRRLRDATSETSGEPERSR